MDDLLIKKDKLLKFFYISLLFLLTTQNVFVEGYGVSNIKVAFMCLAPLIFIFYVPNISRAFILGMAYLILLFVVALTHTYVRYSTILYLTLFVFSIITAYNIIYCNVISLKDFITIIKFLILLYFLFLVLQQLSILLGIYNFPLINLNNQHFLAIDKLPSLSIEPSHSARILTAAMLAYLKCNEFLEGKHLLFSDLFKKKHRIVTIGFLWTMLTMGSGTAFIGLGILSIYFITLKTSFYIIPLMGIVFLIAANMEIKQLDRSLRVIEATMSGNTDEIRKTDGSAASRIVPIINTFKDLDFLSKETWLGMGTTSKEYNEVGWKRENVKLGAIEQYGILTYILSLVFVFKCCIRKIFSLETLIFIILLSVTLANIYYLWGILLIFIGVRYFYTKYMNIL